jgi:hypothetical protein
MNRQTRRALAALAVGLVLFGLGPAVRAGTTFKGKLSRPVDVAAVDNATLNEALEFLSKRFDFKFRIDTEAFANAGVQEVGQSMVKVAQAKKTALSKVLQMVLNQVQGTYRIEKDVLVVVTRKK